ncbi:MAG: hypothetical protein AAF354_07350 [Pseudomonadota bacterium]
MKQLVTLAVASSALILAACSDDADVASANLSRAAANFEVDRRIVFFNGITDSYLMTIEGRCSITADGADQQLEVTCQTPEGEHLKHFLGLSDNVSYFVEQLEAVEVSVNRYRVIFRPDVIVPDIDVRGFLDPSDQ